MTVIDRVAAADADRVAGPLLRAIDVVRDYPSGDTVIHALRGVSLAADPGELVAVRGRSGSGKTTFLNILGGLDHPTSGRVIIDGHEVSSMSEDELVGVRRRSVAFIFQSFGLVPILSAAENVEIPLRLVRAPTRDRDARVRELLELVGLGAGPSIVRTSCRVASSSGSRSRAHWRTGHGSCSPTSRLASSTRRPAT